MLILVFAIQFEVIEVSLRAHFVRRTAMTSVWAPFFELRHFFFSFIIVFPAALLLMTWPRARQHLRRFENAAAAHLRLPRFAAHSATAYIACRSRASAICARHRGSTLRREARRVAAAAVAAAEAAQAFRATYRHDVWKRLLHSEAMKEVYVYIYEQRGADGASADLPGYT